MEVPPRATLRAKGQLTLPPEVRAALRIVAGDEVEFVLEAPGVVAIRGLKLIPADQAWFWTPEWQAGEREAQADLEAGRVETYDSADEFLRALEP
jgi:bifunctional DNA-binding transcriptional regulator/antitoxin component of YhaV-PrlF toxin-antitoxin module